MLHKAHIQLFNQLLDELWYYEGHERNILAEEAGVSPNTLYKWQVDPPISPQLRTFASVAEAMGYKLALVKDKKNKVTDIRRAA